MGCKTCGTAGRLEVCLHCGHSFCKMHRDVIDGLPACTGCLKEEKARRRKPRAKAEPAAPASKPIVAGEVVGTPVEGATPVAPPLVPRPEPKVVGPLVIAAAVATPSATYMWWLLNKLTLEHDWATPIPMAGTVAFGVFVFAGVWAIAKSK